MQSWQLTTSYTQHCAPASCCRGKQEYACTSAASAIVVLNLLQRVDCLEVPASSFTLDVAFQHGALILPAPQLFGFISSYFCIQACQVCPAASNDCM
jgi:hypothetical protein